jgi:hypothetical protein
LCTRGRVHIFKYLEIQAIKEDKKRGILSEELRRTHRKAGHLSDFRFANGISAELRQKRYTVDSGYSTSDGMDKRWSQEIGKVRDLCSITCIYYFSFISSKVEILVFIYPLLLVLTARARGVLTIFL